MSVGVACLLLPDDDKEGVALTNREMLFRQLSALSLRFYAGAALVFGVLFEHGYALFSAGMLVLLWGVSLFWRTGGGFRPGVCFLVAGLLWGEMR